MTVILTFHHSTGSQQNASRGRVLAFYRIAPCLSSPLTAAMKTDLKLPILPCGLGLWDVCFSFDNVFLNSCSTTWVWSYWLQGELIVNQVEETSFLRDMYFISSTVVDVRYSRPLFSFLLGNLHSCSKGLGHCFSSLLFRWANYKEPCDAPSTVTCCRFSGAWYERREKMRGVWPYVPQWINTQDCHRSGNSRERKFFKVWQKSGNVIVSQGKLTFWWKIRENPVK